MIFVREDLYKLGGRMRMITNVTTTSYSGNSPHIVIVGAGFGGLTTAKHLKNANARVTLIDRNNYHLFIPLLYQVATAGLSPADIAVPIRHILRRQKNTSVVMGEVTHVDPSGKTLEVDGHRMRFDYLVLALGSNYNYFGHENWNKVAPSLRTVPEALNLRARILRAFERAESESDPQLRGVLTTFCIVGGGPTGVEIAGAIAELAHCALKRDFRHIDPKQTKILLIEAGPRILSMFPEDLASKAARALQKLGVQLRSHSQVTHIGPGQLKIGDDIVEADTIIWAAGVQAPKVGQWLSQETDKTGRVKVGSDLSIPQYPEIFVIGDSAHVIDANGKPLPGLAPIAIQQGKYVAKAILARIAGSSPPRPFKYKDKGQLATVGRSFAVAQFGTFKIYGFIAWIVWAVVHIYYLIGFENRLLVFVQWAWSYFTYQRGARLIVSHDQREG